MISIDDKIKRFIKFGFVGILGAVIDFTIFSVCAFFLKSVLDKKVIDLILPVFSYEIAVANNFIFSYFWVWKDRKRAIAITFVKYNLGTLLAFVIRFTLFQGSLHILKISVTNNYIFYVGLYALAIGIGMAINFMLMEFHVFKKIE